MSEVKATVVDSLTNEPMSFVSVYVIPAKDTTITNFTLTDAKGEAKLDEVPFGSYTFHVEMMGYKPFVKEKYFREREVDMGTIRLQTDENFLQAAVVNDVGNPMVVKKDTVEFNASAFRVGANAMLKDLLERMPGMEITEDGKVKFNGEEIDKLTVGGRTFFFNDQSTALNNLPASVVDKIRVIDRESEATRASGIQDGSREKVLDVGLKKEYEKGWFGNVSLKGGTTLGEKEEDNPLRDDRGALYSANALLSAYGEKDQVTVIANGQNINDSNAVFVLVTEEGEESSSDMGLSSAAQLGVNANTTRIKDVETTVGANYKYTDTNTGSSTERTTYQDDSNLDSSSERSGRGFAESVSANMEFKKEKGKVWFYIRPSFRHDKSDKSTHGNTMTMRDGGFVNSSNNSSWSRSTDNTADISTDFTIRELGGRSNRTLNLNFDASYSHDAGESEERSLLNTLAGDDLKALTYQSDGFSSWVGGSLAYNEPLGEKWTLSTSAEISRSGRGRVRDAFDAPLYALPTSNGYIRQEPAYSSEKNEYYSSVNKSKYVQQSYEVTAQYKWGDQSWLTFGGKVLGVLDETYTKSYGTEKTVGEGEWDWHVVPTVRFQHGKDNDRVYFSASGYTMRPGTTRMMPTLDISDLSRLSLGNVYLKPHTQTNFYANWTRNNIKKFSNVMAYLYGDFDISPINSALWYDQNGILYSIPVNSRKPASTVSGSLYYTTPLDSKKNWSLTVAGNASLRSSTSYQARTTLPGPDKDHFDYSAFMEEFWGDASGDRFYSGQSGFAESRTRTFSPGGSIGVKYNQERYSLLVRAYTNGNISRYSLDPSINMNTMDFGVTARGSYTTRHEFEFESDLTYGFYKGYAEGYGLPEWQWNAEISKNIKAFTLSIKANDILNQTRSLRHTVTANYTEDSYSLIMGRYILLGIKWNFGKMNASHSQRAENAAWNMAW